MWSTEQTNEILDVGRSANITLFDRSVSKDAPEYDSAVLLTHAFEQRLHDHYERKDYWDALEAFRIS